MSRALLVLHSAIERERACMWIDKAPVGTRVEFKAPKRTLPQNDRMHAMLTDIARQVPTWGGVRLHKDDWKLVFLAAIKRGVRLVPNLDETGLVDIGGKSSSDLSKEEMTEMIERMFMFAAQHGVVFSGEKEGAAA